MALDNIRVNIPLPSSPGVSGVKAGEIALPKPSKNTTPIAKAVAEATVDLGKAEAERLETLRRGAQQLTNAYPLGENKISIYKDGSGQYITRSVNQRTGQVTYIPEPSILEFLQRRGENIPSNVSLTT